MGFFSFGAPSMARSALIGAVPVHVVVAGLLGGDHSTRHRNDRLVGKRLKQVGVIVSYFWDGWLHEPYTRPVRTVL